MEVAFVAGGMLVCICSCTTLYICMVEMQSQDLKQTKSYMVVHALITIKHKTISIYMYILLQEVVVD